MLGNEEAPFCPTFERSFSEPVSSLQPPGSVAWRFEGHDMWLLPQKAVWWPSESMLIVSDLHLAKAEHFRSQGLAVPPTVDFQTLAALTALIQQCQPRQLMLLGDLFHSTPNRAWADFKAWLKDELAAGLDEAMLVRGNHDKAQDEVYRDMGVWVLDMWENQGVVLTHEPDDPIPSNARIHLCGHIHPAAMMRGKGKQSERVPCFVQTSTGCNAGRRLILPAFGAFTGMHTVQPQSGMEVFVATEKEVMGPWRAAPDAGVNRGGRR